MPSSSTSPRIGLALGSGGARGLSQIPVLEALDELGIKPVKIAGSSIGAIFGAAYASGLSGREIRKLTLELFADRNSVLSRLWQLRPKRFRDVFRSGPVQFDPERVLEVFISEHLPNRFKDLNIPLRLVATDFYACEEADFESGPLLPAIAASIAIPAIFRPMQIDGRHLIDGGVSNPLPFDGLRSSCDIVIAVDVVGAPVRRGEREDISMLDSLFGSSQILMQSITRHKLATDQPDILIRPPHDSVRVLDFLKADRILENAEPLKEITRNHLTSILEDVMQST